MQGKGHLRQGLYHYPHLGINNAGFGYGRLDLKRVLKLKMLIDTGTSTKAMSTGLNWNKILDKKVANVNQQYKDRPGAGVIKEQNRPFLRMQLLQILEQLCKRPSYNNGNKSAYIYAVILPFSRIKINIAIRNTKA